MVRFMELRKKGLIYIRKSASIPAGTKNYELAKWTSPKYDEILGRKEYLTKASITHIGNATATSMVYELQYGEKWRFDYQIGKLNDPFQFPVPLDVELDEIIVLVDNLGTSDSVAEICIVGFYERERFKKLDNQIPNALGHRL